MTSVRPLAGQRADGPPRQPRDERGPAPPARWPRASAGLSSVSGENELCVVSPHLRPGDTDWRSVTRRRRSTLTASSASAASGTYRAHRVIIPLRHGLERPICLDDVFLRLVVELSGLIDP